MSRRWLLRVAGAAAIAAYVLLCLASAEGSLSGDDHYALWAAAAFQRGDRPNVDFFDPGSPLQWWLSYVGQVATGNRTLGEILVAISLKTAGVVAVFRLSTELLGRRLYAVVPTAVVVASQLAYQVYGADKAFIYPVAMLVAWAYLRGRVHPSLLGLLIGVAFLLRHDHGAYVMALMSAAIVTGPRPTPRAMSIAGLTALAFCSPWLWWLFTTEGIVHYFRSRIAFSSSLGLTEARPFFVFVTPYWSVENAARFLWHVAFALPFVGLAAGIRTGDRRIVLLSLTLLLLEAGIMRRGPQVTETALLWAPLFAWLLAAIRRGPAALALRLVAVASVVPFLVVTGAPARLHALTLDEGGIVARAGRAVAFHGVPRSHETYVAPDERSERLMVRYVAECLAASDRIWDTSVWFPLSYYSGRLSVWHPYWELGFLSDDTSQRAFLSWIQSASVPVIIVRKRQSDPLDAFRHYSSVREYVAGRYVRATSETFERFVTPLGDNNSIQVLTDVRRMPTGVFEPLDLPCFAPRMVGAQSPQPLEAASAR